MEVNLNPGPLSLVSREEWGGLPPPDDQEDFLNPCIAVRIWKNSNTPRCTSKEDCIRIVQEIQNRDIAAGFGDIRFNFLIGEDGNAYEGRGYHKKPPKDDAVFVIEGKYLEIAFIGDHRRTQTSNNIYYLAYLISNSAVEKGALKFEANCFFEE